MQRFVRLLRSRPVGTLAASAGTGLALATTVTSEDENSNEPKAKPSHWANTDGTKFVNPWPSFRDVVSRALHSPESSKALCAENSRSSE